MSMIERFERCNGPGAKRILTKDEARESLASFRKRYGSGRGTFYRCQYGDHYHVSKSSNGRRSS